MVSELDASKRLLEQSIEKLEEELRKLLAERATVEADYRAKVEPLDSRIAVLESVRAHQQEALAAFTFPPNGVVNPARQANRASDTLRIAETARQVLRQEGKPLHYRAIAERIQMTGQVLRARDAGTMVINYLRREPETFCRTSDRGCYALIEWNLANAKPVAGERPKGVTTKRKTSGKRTAARKSGKAAMK